MNPSNVDPVKCPRLYAKLKALEEQRQAGWGKVTELKRTGDTDAAGKLSKKLLGVKTTPMTPERKAELKEYNEIHKDEIKDRRRQEREVRKRTVALLTPRQGTKRK